MYFHRQSIRRILEVCPGFFVSWFLLAASTAYSDVLSLEPINNCTVLLSGLGGGHSRTTNARWERELVNRLSQTSGVGSLTVERRMRSALQALNAEGLQLGHPGTLLSRITPESLRQLDNALAVTDSTRARSLITQILGTDANLFPARARNEPVLVVPQANHVAGLVYMVNDAGEEIPVIDLTHPAFQRPMETGRVVTGWLLPRLFRLLPRQIRAEIGAHAPITQGLLNGGDTVLSGERTYYVRLGPEFLPSSYPTIDKVVAGAVVARNTLSRLDSVSDLETAQLRAMLHRHPDRSTVHFVNIGGGTAMDSVNSLLKLQQQSPADFAALRNKEIVISVAALDDSGVSLGRQAIAALQRAGRLPSDMRIRMEYVPYDWTRPSTLLPVLARVSEENALCSVEGSFFEYGSRQVIQDNLRVIADNTPSDVPVIGTSYRDPQTIHTVVPSLMTVVPRIGWQLHGMNNISSFARDSGWNVATTRNENPVFDTFVLNRPR